jgi:hypothetical protein
LRFREGEKYDIRLPLGKQGERHEAIRWSNQLL